MDEVEHKIVITFKDEGSVFFSMEVSGNVYPDQFGMLSQRFSYQANRMREDARAAYMLAEQERENRNRIMVPTSKDGAFQ